jgi:hypothetical protein
MDKLENENKLYFKGKKGDNQNVTPVTPNLAFTESNPMNYEKNESFTIQYIINEKKGGILWILINRNNSINETTKINDSTFQVF